MLAKEKVKIMFKTILITKKTLEKIQHKPDEDHGFKGFLIILSIKYNHNKIRTVHFKKFSHLNLNNLLL